MTTYTIICQRSDGFWTDDLGPGDNTWPSAEAAQRAITELEAIGWLGPWAIVKTITCPHRDLVH